MFDRDHWHEIWIALSRNKARTLLTAFGVFWGIFMLVVMLGSGNGLRNGATRDFANGATNSFFVWTQRTTKPYRGLPAGRSFEFSNADAAAIRQRVPEVGVLAPRNQLGGFQGGNNVTRGTRAGAFSVMGDEPQILDIDPVNITAGRFLNPLDLEERRKVAVIGNRVQELLFERGENPIGDHVKIAGVYFKVVGTFEPFDEDQNSRDAETIYVPFTTFQKAFNYGDQIGWFAITSAPGVPASLAQEEVIDLLKQRHRVHPEDLRGIGSWNSEQEYLRIQGLFQGITILVWVVGIGTLSAGVIGVSNIMLIIVRERTKEIGLRRAIGATPMSITRQIVLESIVLTALAGYIGLVLGVGLLEVARLALDASGGQAGMFRSPEIDLQAAVQALLILIVSGAAAGLIPARRAVAISPVKALRSE